ncbi:MAG: vanadium-dependent haloperoxidase [Candidatus Zixiibacteriota bacterium]
MKRAGLGFILFLLAVSCSKQNPLVSNPSTRFSSNEKLNTFFLCSADDSRLPAPMAEDQNASPAERAFLEKPGVGSNGISSANPNYNNPAAFWNDVTTELGRKSALPPPRFSRAYALVQVAIYDALVAASDARRGGLKETFVAAGAASEVLLYLFPNDETRIQDAVASQFGNHRLKGNFARAWFLGKRVGELAVDYGKNDGSGAVFTGTPPSGDCIWNGSNPVLPMCGTWKTWIISSGSEIQPPPPYPCGSAADSADLEEVYQVALSRTPEQAEIVHKWADLPPPTIWNDYLNRRLIGQRWDALRSARAQAYLNVTMYDAFVCCWKTKYDFWTARPFMRLGGRTPAFTTVITTPNFPSYTSGHSTISAAAAEVMKELFPDERDFFQREAEEAALSRLWGGIHYQQDNVVGLHIGEKVGTHAVRRMQSDRSFPLRAGN